MKLSGRVRPHRIITIEHGSTIRLEVLLEKNNQVVQLDFHESMLPSLLVGLRQAGAAAQAERAKQSPESLNLVD